MAEPMNRQTRNAARMPKQKRGLQTRKKIMTAGERLFVKHGFHQVPVESIAEAAGVSVGSFYAYFNDKRELFLALVDQLLGRISARLTDSIGAITDAPGLTVRDFIKQAVQVIFNAHNTAPGMLRETSRMAMLDDAVQSRLDEVDAPVQATIADALKSKLGWNQKGAMTAAFVIYHAVEGVIHRLVLNPGEMDENAAAVELTAMLTAYIENR